MAVLYATYLDAARVNDFNYTSVSLSRCTDNFVWDLKVLDEQLRMTIT